MLQNEGQKRKREEGNEFYAVVTKRDYTFARQLRTLWMRTTSRPPARFFFSSSPFLCLPLALLSLSSFSPFCDLSSWCVHALTRHIPVRETSSRAAIFGEIVLERIMILILVTRADAINFGPRSGHAHPRKRARSFSQIMDDDRL